MNEAAQRLLQAMAAGRFLKSHRDIEGRKAFVLHKSGGVRQEIDPTLVGQLREAGLIDSNKKFPVATFWLTEEGRQQLKSRQQEG